MSKQTIYLDVENIYDNSSFFAFKKAVSTVRGVIWVSLHGHHKLIKIDFNGIETDMHEILSCLHAKGYHAAIVVNKGEF